MIPILVKTDGTKIEFLPKNKKNFTCKELYKILDCQLVEEVGPTNNDEIMICDEEGKLNGALFNEVATNWFRTNFPLYPDVIMGDVIICNSKYFK